MTQDQMFADREDAARRLAGKLGAYKGHKDAVVLAIPRGGVVTGAVLAKELDLPLDIILTKKIGHPLVPEFAIGVVNLTNEAIDDGVIERDQIPREYLERQIKSIRSELRRRYETYRGGRRPVEMKGKTVILADDGVATGNTMLAAIRLARREKAAKIVVAVPVGPADTLEQLKKLADEVAFVIQPDYFFAIGQFYDQFDQVEDAEAIRLLNEAPHPSAAS